MFNVYVGNDLVGTLTYAEVLKLSKDNKQSAEWFKTTLVIGNVVYEWKGE